MARSLVPCSWSLILHGTTLPASVPRVDLSVATGMHARFNRTRTPVNVIGARDAGTRLLFPSPSSLFLFLFPPSFHRCYHKHCDCRKIRAH